LARWSTRETDEADPAGLGANREVHQAMLFLSSQWPATIPVLTKNQWKWEMKHEDYEDILWKYSSVKRSEGFAWHIIFDSYDANMAVLFRLVKMQDGIRQSARPSVRANEFLA